MSTSTATLIQRTAAPLSARVGTAPAHSAPVPNIEWFGGSVGVGCISTTHGTKRANPGSLREGLT